MQDENFEEIRIIQVVAPQWEHMAVALGMNQDTINNLAKDHACNAHSACYNMFARWIGGCGGDVSWALLVDALSRIDEKALAKRIEQSKKSHA